MQWNSLLSIFSRAVRIAVALSLVSPMVHAQLGGSLLNATRARLQALSNCVGPDFEPMRELEVGLLRGYNGAAYQGGGRYGGSAIEGPIPPPDAYSDSLDRDIQACRAAATLDGDDRKALLEGVRRDIEIKAKDCHKFGMGRIVAVRVSTMKGSQKDDGWEVYYKWNCSSAFQPAEMRASKLTSPAVVQLPPGNYTFRAQKRMQDNQVVNTQPTVVVVGMDKAADIQIPIQ
jgi:hypothetical protein